PRPEPAPHRDRVYTRTRRVATALDTDGRRPKCTSMPTPGPLAVSLLALQREGALGARLEGHRARPPGAPARAPPPAGAVAERPEVRAGFRRRRTQDRGLDADHRGTRGAPTGAGALPARPGAAPASARARGVLRHRARTAGKRASRRRRETTRPA